MIIPRPVVSIFLVVLSETTVFAKVEIILIIKAIRYL